MHFSSDIAFNPCKIFFFEQYATRMGGFAYLFYEIAAWCGLPKQIPIVLRGYIMAYVEMHGL